MERNVIREVIDDSITRLKFGVDRIKWGKDLIEPIVNIDDMAFNKTLLLLG